MLGPPDKKTKQKREDEKRRDRGAIVPKRSSSQPWPVRRLLKKIDRKLLKVHTITQNHTTKLTRPHITSANLTTALKNYNYYKENHLLVVTRRDTTHMHKHNTSAPAES